MKFHITHDSFPVLKYTIWNVKNSCGVLLVNLHFPRREESKEKKNYIFSLVFMKYVFTAASNILRKAIDKQFIYLFTEEIHRILYFSEERLFKYIRNKELKNSLIGRHFLNDKKVKINKYLHIFKLHSGWILHSIPIYFILFFYEIKNKNNTICFK